jgi:DNA processing protein
MSDKLQYPFYEVALTLVENIGAVTAKQLISYSGSAEAVFSLSEGKLLKIPNVGIFTAKAIVAQKNEVLQKAEKIIQQAEKEGVTILTYHHPNFPPRLKNLYDSPILLYVKGNANLNSNKTIAIVGTRDATDYGKSVTENLISDLKTHNPLIVSGLAYGIDIFAHRAALQNNLATVGVMASGIDVIYPAVHHKTALQMINQDGAIITENPFGTKPDAMRFPARNRIIAGLADVIIVVEAKIKGGALITAQIANDYHKEVLAVPGSIYQKASEGCNYLIKNHQAHVFTSVVDIENLLNWQVGQTSTPRQTSLNFDDFDLSAVEKQLLSTIKDSPQQELSIDEMTFRLQLPISQVSALLLNLELLGLIKAMPGKKFGLKLK